MIQECQTPKAILDCGVSESIIGAHTLQALCDIYEKREMDPEQEASVDRSQRRTFIFGKNETSKALGFAMVTIGIGGQNVIIPIHVVEGPTPMLLSSRWLEDLIDFKTGQAQFRCLGDQVVNLERASTNHLMLKVDDFQDGNRLVHSPGAFLAKAASP